MFDPDVFDAASFDTAEFLVSRKTCKARPIQPAQSRPIRFMAARQANISRGTR